MRHRPLAGFVAGVILDVTEDLPLCASMLGFVLLAAAACIESGCGGNSHNPCVSSARRNSVHVGCGTSATVPLSLRGGSQDEEEDDLPEVQFALHSASETLNVSLRFPAAIAMGGLAGEEQWSAVGVRRYVSYEGRREPHKLRVETSADETPNGLLRRLAPLLRATADNMDSGGETVARQADGGDSWYCSLNGRTPLADDICLRQLGVLPDDMLWVTTRSHVSADSQEPDDLTEPWVPHKGAAAGSCFGSSGERRAPSQVSDSSEVMSSDDLSSEIAVERPDGVTGTILASNMNDKVSCLLMPDHQPQEPSRLAADEEGRARGGGQRETRVFVNEVGITCGSQWVSGTAEGGGQGEGYGARGVHSAMFVNETKRLFEYQCIYACLRSIQAHACVHVRVCAREFKRCMRISVLCMHVRVRISILVGTNVCLHSCIHA